MPRAGTLSQPSDSTHFISRRVGLFFHTTEDHQNSALPFARLTVPPSTLSPFNLPSCKQRNRANLHHIWFMSLLSTSSEGRCSFAAAPPQSGQITDCPGTLLLVDDNAIQAATRQAILKRVGYSVLAVLSPEDALLKLQDENLSPPVDLIITDHLMPGMSGAQFVAELRSRGSEIPVIVISGLAEAQDEYASLDVEFHLKPCPPDRLLGSIQRIIEAHRSSPAVLSGSASSRPPSSV